MYSEVINCKNYEQKLQEKNVFYRRKGTETRHVPGKQGQGRCTYHDSMDACLELTTEVMHLPQKGRSLSCLQLNPESMCPLGVTMDLTFYSIIM